MMLDLHTLIFVSWLRLQNRIAYYCIQKRKETKRYSSRILHIILFSAMIAFYGIGIPKNKYAFLNIVYFSLAYIWLTDQTKPNFWLLSSLLSENAQPKEKTIFLRIFSFRCNLVNDTPYFHGIIHISRVELD